MSEEALGGRRRKGCGQERALREQRLAMDCLFGQFRDQAAESLGLHPNNLSRLIRQLGLR